jgi:hypothetical protein
MRFQRWSAAVAVVTAVIITAPLHGQGGVLALPGTYTAAQLTLVFDSTETWRVSLNDVEAVHGVFEVRADTVVLSDRGGPRACSPDVPGTYTWRRDARTLVLETVADACAGRGVLAQEWTFAARVEALEGTFVIDGTGRAAASWHDHPDREWPHPRHLLRRRYAAPGGCDAHGSRGALDHPGAHRCRPGPPWYGRSPSPGWTGPESLASTVRRFRLESS